jgi:hypothetical protein
MYRMRQGDEADQSFTRINGVVFCDTECWKDWRETNKRLSFTADPFSPGRNYEPPLCDDECQCGCNDPPDIAPAEPSTTELEFSLD